MRTVLRTACAMLLGLGPVAPAAAWSGPASPPTEVAEGDGGRAWLEVGYYRRNYPPGDIDFATRNDLPFVAGIEVVALPRLVVDARFGLAGEIIHDPTVSGDRPLHAGNLLLGASFVHRIGDRLVLSIGGALALPTAGNDGAGGTRIDPSASSTMFLGTGAHAFASAVHGSRDPWLWDPTSEIMLLVPSFGLRGSSGALRYGVRIEVGVLSDLHRPPPTGLGPVEGAIGSDGRPIVLVPEERARRPLQVVLQTSADAGVRHGPLLIGIALSFVQWGGRSTFRDSQSAASVFCDLLFERWLLFARFNLNLDAPNGIAGWMNVWGALAGAGVTLP